MKRLFLAIAAIILSGITLSAQEMKWYDPMEGDVCYIEGRANTSEMGDSYHRFPPRLKPLVRDAVWSLSRNSTGLTIKFYCNAPKMTVSFDLADGTGLTNMAAMGSSGIDLYAYDKDGREIWCAAPSGRRLRQGKDNRYYFNDLAYSNCGKEGYLYEMYLPLYNTVTSLKIGIPEGYDLRFVEPSKQKPFIVYGSSIAQGASASRAGLAWSSILKRMFKTPVINLGFSGNGRLEAPIIDLICEVDAAVYILDCIPNMCGMPDKIYPRILEAVAKIRKVSSAPIILTEHCGMPHGISSPKSEESLYVANKECRKAYEALKRQGEKGIYYLSKEDIGLSMESSIDGWHPNDIGMMEYAEAYAKVIRKALKKTK